MASFEGVLANIPGYGGYLAKGQLDRKNTLSDIQQLGGVQGLMAQMQQQQMVQGIRGVLSDTAIPDDQKIQRLAQFGEPGMKVAGTLAQMQKQQADLMRERDFRTGLAGLGENPTQEQLVGLASRFGSPDKVMSIHQGALDRKAQAESAREKGIADRQARLDGITMQLASREMEGEANRALRERLEAQSNDLRRELRASRQEGGSKPPMGYRFKADGSLEAIPGGPADNKIQGALNQDTSSMNSGLASFDRLAAAANEALTAPGLPGTAGLRGAIPNIPGSDAADAAAKLNTLKSQIAFGVLQEMRNNSKTGGALGAVSDKEQEMLKSALAPLEKSQSIEELRKSLKGVIDYANGAKDRMRAAYNMKHGERQTGGATGSFDTPKGPMRGQVVDGYRFKGGDPADKNNWEKP